MSIGSVSVVLCIAVAIALGWYEYNHKKIPLKYESYTPRAPSRYRKVTDLPEIQPVTEKSAFVTGANGFLGTNLVECLLEDGWDVTATHRRGSNTNVLYSMKGKGSGKLTIKPCDVTDIDSIDKAMPNNVGVVFHVAAVIQFWKHRNDRMYQVNVLGTRNIVDISLKKNAGKLVHTSSISVWGGSGMKHPVINEDVPPTANNSFYGYQNTKYLAELEVLAGIKDGLWATMINPSLILGKYDVNSMGRLTKNLQRGELPGIASGKNQVCSAREVAKAHITAAHKGRLGQRYITAGPESSMDQIVFEMTNHIPGATRPMVLPNVLVRILGLVSDIVSDFTLKQPDITIEIADFLIRKRPYVFDSALAVKELGYNDKIDIPTLVKEMVDWQLSSKFF
ncbi:hypothetical protein AAMO2058_001663900 [Amorphochlora amoebiformis]